MVFGNCGVLQEMSHDKGFVEMTGIDAETSQDIAEVCAKPDAFNEKDKFNVYMLPSALLGHYG